MPKLIDADKLKQHYAWWDNEDKKIFDTIVDLQPEAVVRCNDCIYKNGKINSKGFEVCDATGMDITDNDFCSWGARMEEDELR